MVLAEPGDTLAAVHSLTGHGSHHHELTGERGAHRDYRGPCAYVADPLSDFDVRAFWVNGVERHEALSGRAAMKGRRLRVVAAAR